MITEIIEVLKANAGEEMTYRGLWAKLIEAYPERMEGKDYDQIYPFFCNTIRRLKRQGYPIVSKPMIRQDGCRAYCYRVLTWRGEDDLRALRKGEQDP